MVSLVMPRRCSDGGHDDLAAARLTVLELQRDPTAVGEADGVHTFGAGLAEQAVDRMHQLGLVARTPAGVLGVRAERVLHACLESPRGRGGEQAERAGQAGRREREDRRAAAVDGDVGAFSPAESSIAVRISFCSG